MNVDKTEYISLQTKLKLYNVCIKSILLYNLSAVALTKQYLEKICDKNHRCAMP